MKGLIMRDKIINILIDEYHYSQYVAETTANDLLNMQSSLLPLLNDWLENRKVSNKIIEGFDVDYLMNAHQMNYLAALLALDWLLVDPEVAKKELQIVR